MKKKSVFLVLAFSLILLANMSIVLLAHAIPWFPPTTTLANQPLADATDCQGTIGLDGTGWLRNGYVQVSFNTTGALDNMTFYRDTTKILTINFVLSYLDIVELEPDDGHGGYLGLTYNKLQYYNMTAGWIDWNSTSLIPNQYVDYRQQLRVRAIWQDDPDTPLVILIGYFTITRGMPWVQVNWEITNANLGVDADITFVPYLINYLNTNQTVLSSDLKYWNETTTTQSGNAWGSDNPWFTVGFTTNGTVYTSSKTRIMLNDTTYENLAPLNYRAVNGHSTAALWAQDFSSRLGQYNYTFVLQNLDTVPGWHYAELWIPEVVDSIKYYSSADNGTTWSAGIGYNYTSAVGSGTAFHTSNGTAVNATMYETGVSLDVLDNVTGTTKANGAATYTCSDLHGVASRTAFGVYLGGDLGQNPLNSSSAAFIKVQVYFYGPAEYSFDYADSPAFTSEPGQGYGLLDMTDGRLSFIDRADATAGGWAIGMNQTLKTLDVIDYPDRSLDYVGLSWNETVKPAETAGFITNVFGYTSLNTTATAGGDPLVPDVFEYGGDTPRFQFHEALVTTYFAPVFKTTGGYELWWVQRLATTDWNSLGNYTIALPHPNTVGGWYPTSPITALGITRSGSPLVSVYSGVLDLVDFRIVTAAPVVPPLGTGTVPPTSTPSPFPTSNNPVPSATIAPTVEDTLIALVVIALIIVVAIFLVMRRRR